jgi:hypothetical protein
MSFFAMLGRQLTVQRLLCRPPFAFFTDEELLEQ